MVSRSLRINCYEHGLAVALLWDGQLIFLAASGTSPVVISSTSIGDDGKIVGRFQGRMEFGPRALGNRSMVADPRSVAMRARVNDCVKFREGWRPFAPSCMAEAA
jgi:carbamoyltransferase